MRHIKMVFVSSLSHKTIANITSKRKGAMPDSIIIVWHLEKEKNLINCYRRMTFEQLTTNGVSYNDNLCIAARLINIADEMGIDWHLVNHQFATKTYNKLKQAEEIQNVVDTPELWVPRKEPVTASPVRGGQVVREVKVRTGQSDFKHRVNMNFGGRCAISGHNTAELLQACHIQEFSVAQNNSTSNGILLDVGLHVMFDRNLMCINPETMKVHFKEGLVHPYVALYEGVVINKSKVALNTEFLKVRWNMFK